jgi:hypothetical protein
MPRRACVTQVLKESIEMSKTPPAKNNKMENDAPPCGCAIGDLLNVQEENQALVLKDISGDSKKPVPESELPACGCAIGDLLEMQKENKIPGNSDTPRKN